MPSIVGLILCLALIAVLLGIEHTNNRVATTALWIPTIWVMIQASRPIGRWFAWRASSGSLEEGSELDRWVLVASIAVALIVLSTRKVRWMQVVRPNLPLLGFFLFAGLSILWSDFPYLSFKRWFRLVGFLPIAALVLAERYPLLGMESVLRRCTYVLIPSSLMLIKYYPDMGRVYGRWSGNEMWTGVTLTKNALGQLCMVSSLFLVWTLLNRWQDKSGKTNRIATLGDCVVLGMALIMLFGIGGVGERSATSIAVLTGCICGLFLICGLKRFARGFSMTLICGAILIWLTLAFGDSLGIAITPMLGRDSSFTGRTEMWDLLFSVAATHLYLGAGYGGYFGTPGNNFFQEHGVVQAHNGLLEVYVELGLIGIALVVIFHLSLYWRFRRELTRNLAPAAFAVCFLLMSLLCNFSESIFLNSQSYIWTLTVLLSIVFSAPYLKQEELTLPRRGMKVQRTWGGSGATRSRDGLAGVGAKSHFGELRVRAR